MGVDKSDLKALGENVEKVCKLEAAFGLGFCVG